MKPPFAELPLVGYADRPSVEPGGSITFHVSARTTEYRAELVKLIRAERIRENSGVKEEATPSAIDGVYPGTHKKTYCGSYVEIPDHPSLAGTSAVWVQALIFPTAPRVGNQGIITRWDSAQSTGYGLFLDASGRAAFVIGDGQTTSTTASTLPFSRGIWYLIAGGWDETRSAICCHVEAVTQPAGTSPLFGYSHVEPERSLAHVDSGPTDARTRLLIGAWSTTDGDGTRAHFNGKIEAPRLGSAWLERDQIWESVRNPPTHDMVGAWDFSAGIDDGGILQPGRVVDTSPNELHGRCVNLPVRAVTGHNWDGRSTDFTRVPDQYAAMHFHDDSLGDAGWDPDFTLKVPQGQTSGVYAAKLTAHGAEEYIPFFVRPKLGSPGSAVAVLFSTNTYTAYGNNNAKVDVESMAFFVGTARALTPYDLYRHEHRELGNSLYDTHTDGSGVCYASWRRPLLNMGPKDREDVLTSVWLLNADLNLVDWLHQRNVGFDAITDHDLHADGATLLNQYRVVLTGTHPEYWTEQMLDALESYLSAGGRLMYMGGNGLYWVTAYHPDDPSIIEVRRWGGTQAWTAAAGERHLSFTGELGGIWKYRGRPPQRLVGVGFTAQGFDRSGYYERLPDSYKPEAQWIFEGVASERIGDFGLVGGGAAGLELDRYDPTLGSPPHALLLATSHGHTAHTLEARENLGGTGPGLGGPLNPAVRSDVVYFTTPGGGGVFSTGSIAWCGSLSHNDYDNDISRITGNVLNRFADADRGASP